MQMALRQTPRRAQIADDQLRCVHRSGKLQIWVADLDGAHPRRIAKGSDPEISPDGARIVFNTEGEKRRIVVAEVAEIVEVEVLI